MEVSVSKLSPYTSDERKIYGASELSRLIMNMHTESLLSFVRAHLFISLLLWAHAQDPPSPLGGDLWRSFLRYANMGTFRAIQ